MALEIQRTDMDVKLVNGFPSLLFLIIGSPMTIQI
jgi:hypothetical protein